MAPGKLAKLPDAGVIYGHSGLACDVEDFRSEDFAGAVRPLHTELRRYTDFVSQSAASRSEFM